MEPMDTIKTVVAPEVQAAINGLLIALIGALTAWATAQIDKWKRARIEDAAGTGYAVAEQAKKRVAATSDATVGHDEAKEIAVEAAMRNVPLPVRLLPSTIDLVDDALEKHLHDANAKKAALKAVEALGKQAAQP